MSVNRVIEAPNAPAPVGSYSQAKQIGRFLQVSGQIPIDPQTGGILQGSVTEQVSQVLAQIDAILAHGGAGWSDVLISRVYLSTDQDFDEFDAAYGRHVPEPYPARVTVGAELAPGVLVEIEVLAVLPDTA
ncbi:Rid family detoxifying hydrolase [Paenarthrobacter sp. GOM3]|uniref:Rid family detoxifying hydrolase n=1 Tax=Paenarthrobacter sp. GOM3 TaxID=2782567 RepID=UPI001BA513E3|nr:Rid family detoxifying hydrolase [Paenarthrobacter sp. GOM3]WOH20494.1 Rid family detoxifying hydrolase [Paenarthrobacter sp. GOM3]